MTEPNEYPVEPLARPLLFLGGFFDLGRRDHALFQQ
jgi:hypothetical protein